MVEYLKTCGLSHIIVVKSLDEIVDHFSTQQVFKYKKESNSRF